MSRWSDRQRTISAQAYANLQCATGTRALSVKDGICAPVVPTLAGVISD
jgi:hypothetical protein